jgi:hypothetical protein
MKHQLQVLASRIVLLVLVLSAFAIPMALAAGLKALFNLQ